MAWIKDGAKYFRGSFNTTLGKAICNLFKNGLNEKYFRLRKVLSLKRSEKPIPFEVVCYDNKMIIGRIRYGSRILEINSIADLLINKEKIERTTSGVVRILENYIQ